MQQKMTNTDFIPEYKLFKRMKKNVFNIQFLNIKSSFHPVYNYPSNYKQPTTVSLSLYSTEIFFCLILCKGMHEVWRLKREGGGISNKILPYNTENYIQCPMINRNERVFF